MDTYGILREFADSWFLLAMFFFFICAIIWVFWPSRRKEGEEAALIPFHEDDARRTDRTHQKKRNEDSHG